MKNLQTNTVVLGAGPGGYAAAIRLGQLNIETILIEEKNVGGTCLNIGCIPSKALLHASGTFTALKKDLIKIGISVENPTINWPTTITWKDQLVNKLSAGIETLLKHNQVTLIKGSGKLQSTKNLLVKSDEEEYQIQAQNIILATGSQIIKLSDFPVDHQTILDSSDLLSLQKIPQSMIILGGGVIGMELATVYANLGCKITVLEMAEQILNGCENEAIQIVQRELKKTGCQCLTAAKALHYQLTDAGIQVQYEAKNNQKTIETEKLAVIVGRSARLNAIDFEKVPLEMLNHQIVVNDRLQTNIPHIYAIGDIINGPMLAHKATAEGIAAAEIIAGHHALRKPFHLIPSVVYTKPEIAQVGITEQQAQADNIDIVVGKFPFAASGRALASNEPLGFVKYIAQAQNQQIIGATIVSNKASELIAEAVLAIEKSATLTDLEQTIHPHPSLSEAHMEATAAGLKKAIHIMN